MVIKIYSFSVIIFLALLSHTWSNDLIQLRVIAYNIKNANGGDNLQAIADVINEEDPDYVGYQEVDSVTTRVGGIDEPRQLGELTNMYWDFAYGIQFGGGSYGNSMTSKLPIIRSSRIALPGSEARSALVTDIDVSDGIDTTNAIVSFISTHWMNGSTADQLASAQIINAWIDSVIADSSNRVDENWPWLLLGDLNAYEGSTPIDEMKSHWITSDFNYGIDWLFYRPTTRWNWVESRKIADPDEELSDHEAVVSDVELINVDLSGNPIRHQIQGENSKFRVVAQYPSAGSLKLAVTGDKKILSLELLDLKGQPVKSSYRELKNNAGELLVQRIPARGIYLLKILSPDNRHFIKKVF